MIHIPQVLIVEADASVATHVEEQLERAGYGVLNVSASVEAVLDLMAETAPDVVLLDRALDVGMDGTHAAEQIQMHFDAPVIYLTACLDGTTVSPAVQAHAVHEDVKNDPRRAKMFPYGFVAAPFTVDALRSAIEMALYKHAMDERLRASEEALRESERRFRIVADFTYDWEYWIDPDGCLVYVSPSCERITGYGPRAFMRDPALLKEILHPDNEEHVVQRFETSLREPMTYATDLHIVPRDEVVQDNPGHWISYACQPIYDAEGRWLGQRVSCRDITCRKQMEAALRRERDFAESLIDTAQTIVLVLDKEGRILRFNPYLEQISGYQLVEVQGQDWFSTFLPEEDRDKMRTLFSQAVNDIQTRGNINAIVTKDGRRRDIEWYDKTLRSCV